MSAGGHGFIPPVGEWADNARCATVATEIFFPIGNDPVDATAAKQICQHCPVQRPCLDHAVGHSALDGIWGGTTEQERDRIRRTRRHTAIVAIDEQPDTQRAEPKPAAAAKGTMLETLERLAQHPDCWARIARYDSKHSAAAVASLLRAGKRPVPPGHWQFQGRVNDTGGSDLYAILETKPAEGVA